MRNLAIFLAVSGMLAFADGRSTLAQRGGGRGGARMYDPRTVETVTGTVEKVERIPGKGRGGAGGVHLLLQSGKEEISVHLGPSWYLEKEPLKIAAQDTIEVRGSRVVFEGKPAIIAAEVKRGDQTLKLRDDNGVPVWSGGRWTR